MNGKLLCALRFADDVLLLASSKYKLKQLLQDLITASRAVGLEVHPEETEILRNRFAGASSCRGHLVVGDKQLDILVETEQLCILAGVCAPNIATLVKWASDLNAAGRSFALGSESCAARNIRLEIGSDSLIVW